MIKTLSLAAAKGGTGLTTTAAIVALAATTEADKRGARVLLVVDEMRDALALLGLPAGAGDQESAVVTQTLTLSTAFRADRLSQAELDDNYSHIVFDRGLNRDEHPVDLLVVRPDYVTLSAALKSAPRPSGVVMLTFPGNWYSLNVGDVEAVLGTDVIAELEWSANVQRACDAGLLAARLPKLAREVGEACWDWEGDYDADAVCESESEVSS